MELKVETYLPIGSVVLLKGTKQELMITGFCVAHEIEGETKVYDYLACLWPMGVIDTNKNFVFNQEDIEMVIFKGLEDDMEKSRREKIHATAQAVKDAIDRKGASHGSGK